MSALIIIFILIAGLLSICSLIYGFYLGSSEKTKQLTTILETDANISKDALVAIIKSSIN